MRGFESFETWQKRPLIWAAYRKRAARYHLSHRKWNSKALIRGFGRPASARGISAANHHKTPVFVALLMISNRQAATEPEDTHREASQLAMPKMWQRRVRDRRISRNRWPLRKDFRRAEPALLDRHLHPLPVHRSLSRRFIDSDECV